MAVEWREEGDVAYVEVGLNVAPHGGEWSYSIHLGDCLVKAGIRRSRDAAKSAALAEARRLLTKAMEELGDG